MANELTPEPMPMHLIATYLGGGAEPGSMKHEEAKAALQLHIATSQGGTAEEALKWAKVSAVSAATATAIALAALFVAAL